MDKEVGQNTREKERDGSMCEECKVNRGKVMEGERPKSKIDRKSQEREREKEAQ